MKTSYLIVVLVLYFLMISGLEAQKKPLDIDDIESWNRITETVLSPDGHWIAYKTEPWKGDSQISLYTSKGEKKFEYPCGTAIQITDNSQWMIFTVEPEKPKQKDMPGDVLGIYTINTGKLDLIEDIKNYKIPGGWSGWLAYQKEAIKEQKSETGVQEKKESKENGFSLRLHNLENGKTSSWPFITEYHFAGKARKLFFISTGDEKEFEAGVYLYDLETLQTKPLTRGENQYLQLSITEKGDKVAFLMSLQNGNTPEEFSLYVWTGEGKAEKSVSNNRSEIPDGWEISKNGRITFSDNGERIFFGIAPLRPERDPNIPDDEFPDLDIWHWEEGLLHTVQLVNKDRELKRTYLTMIDLNQDKLVQIETVEIPQSRLLDKGNADHVLLISGKPYELQSMWDYLHQDIYLLDLTTGKKKMIKKNIHANIQVSPGSQYLVWYDYADYSYYTYHIESGKEYLITEPALIRADWETNTTFDKNDPYGTAGWLKEDRAVLVYDRYDIWKVDPENRSKPINLTVNGRKNRTVYRLISFNGENQFVDENATQYLTGVNDTSRSSGYFKWNLNREPELLTGGEYRLSTPLKAKGAETIVYTKETFDEFPDLIVSDLKFRNSKHISNANPQQDEFLWGTVELYEWTSLDGRRHEGLLYKPEDFDPSRKYPMIVQFFHKSSDQLFYYRTPEFSRSRIDYHYFVSNGYIIFSPDIYFEPGYVGESAYKSIMPGVTALVGEGFVDPGCIGIQGHSYSGYQIAYLATRTNMFACIQSGAPVVNFFSAYGSIRWESGRNRAFQYEHHQTLGSPWEVPLRFLENSPIFYLDKVTTPILILHNDHDGAVPWYQGIEFFIALRRMQKPVWLLNYNKEFHGITQYKNKKDFQIRLSQFFGHYLKGEPMPEWMYKGVPAIDKGHNLGYDLIY